MHIKKILKGIYTCIKYSIIFSILALGTLITWFLSDDTGYCLDIGYQYNDPKCIKVMKSPAEQ